MHLNSYIQINNAEKIMRKSSVFNYCSTCNYKYLSNSNKCPLCEIKEAFASEELRKLYYVDKSLRVYKIKPFCIESIDGPIRFQTIYELNGKAIELINFGIILKNIEPDPILKQITIKEALELQGYQFCKKCISFHKKKDPCIPLDMEELAISRTIKSFSISLY